MRQTCDRLAELLEYPGTGLIHPESGPAREPAADQGSAPHDALVAEFAEEIRGLSLEQLQELYVQTFELNPVCSLEIGWHLFGENYERGEFLVKVREELRRYGVAESTELPDHLTHVMRLLGRMETEEAGRFIDAFLVPALQKMLVGLGGKNNPYEKVLRAVEQALACSAPEEKQAEDVLLWEAAHE